MALREITDQPLAADASVWARLVCATWNREDAEFERADWWRVHGDQ